jgi:hypothetical protein
MTLELIDLLRRPRRRQSWLVEGHLSSARTGRGRSKLVFDWFDPERRERRKTISLDRKYLAARSRRFLRNFLNSDEMQKPEYYRLVEEASKNCHPADSFLSSSAMNDAEIAEATSNAAMTIVLKRGKSMKGDRREEFVTDAYATVGVAYHRAAGLYSIDRTMQKLGTAAAHLLTMATSYTGGQSD